MSFKSICIIFLSLQKKGEVRFTSIAGERFYLFRPKMMNHDLEAQNEI